jgi:cytosine/adenosine deaminase-related metal-dependent hydrolase
MRGIGVFSAADDSALRSVAEEVWAISNVFYFDTDKRALRNADIEIYGNEIVGITPPGTSTAPEHLDGSRFVCMPGLVNGCLLLGGRSSDGEVRAAVQSHGADRSTQLRDALSQAVLSGVTTIGTFTTRTETDVSVVAAVGIRASLYREYMDVWLGPEHQPAVKNVAECLHDYEQTLRQFDSPALTIQPAVGSQLGASTHLLTALHDLVKEKGRRLVIRVDGGFPWTESFRDAYGCSGLALLRSLDVLDENTLIVPTEPISQLDRGHLRKCNTNVVHRAGELGAKAGRQGRTARVDITCRRQVSLAWNRGELPNAADRAGCARRDFAGDVIDLLTWKGAQALQFPETGSLAIGKRADFLLYDRRAFRGACLLTVGCGPILELIADNRPQAVVIDGRWAVREYALATWSACGTLADLSTFDEVSTGQVPNFQGARYEVAEAMSGELPDPERRKSSRSTS